MIVWFNLHLNTAPEYLLFLDRGSSRCSCCCVNTKPFVLMWGMITLKSSFSTSLMCLSSLWSIRNMALFENLKRGKGTQSWGGKLVYDVSNYSVLRPFYCHYWLAKNRVISFNFFSMSLFQSFIFQNNVSTLFDQSPLTAFRSLEV